MTKHCNFSYTSWERPLFLRIFITSSPLFRFREHNYPSHVSFPSLIFVSLLIIKYLGLLYLLPDGFRQYLSGLCSPLLASSKFFVLVILNRSTDPPLTTVCQKIDLPNLPNYIELLLPLYPLSCLNSSFTPRLILYTHSIPPPPFSGVVSLGLSHINVGSDSSKNRLWVN